MSDTPRTDSLFVKIDGELPPDFTGDEAWEYVVALREHARQLERELRIAQCPLHDCCKLRPDRAICFYPS